LPQYEDDAIGKVFVNWKSKGGHKIKLLRQPLNEIGREKIHQVLELGSGVGYVSALLAKAYQTHVRGSSTRTAERWFNSVVLREAGPRTSCPPPSGYAKNYELGVTEKARRTRARFQMCKRQHMIIG
jgi:hypothetical protein